MKTRLISSRGQPTMCGVPSSRVFFNFLFSLYTTRASPFGIRRDIYSTFFFAVVMLLVVYLLVVLE
jgi:hypothetical protein